MTKLDIALIPVTPLGGSKGWQHAGNTLIWSALTALSLYAWRRGSRPKTGLACALLSLPITIFNGLISVGYRDPAKLAFLADRYSLLYRQGEAWTEGDAEMRALLLREIPGSTQEKLITRDQRIIDAVWIPATERPQDRYTVVINHAIGQTLNTWYPEAQRLSKQGYNVLLTTIGGYPSPYKYIDNTDGADGRLELKQYADVDAAWAFLKAKGCNQRIGWFGNSIGSLRATYGASISDGDLFLKHPFGQIADVPKWLSESRQTRVDLCPIIDGLASQRFPTGKKNRTITDAITNGWNNEARIAKVTGCIHIIQAEKDQLMDPQTGNRLRAATSDRAVLKIVDTGHGHGFRILDLINEVTAWLPPAQ